MNWNKLKDYKCPECGTPLTNNIAVRKNHICENCKFTISDLRYQQIMKPSPRKRYQEPDRSDW